MIKGTSKQLLKRLDNLKHESPNENQFIVFIKSLLNGRYEVTEYVTINSFKTKRFKAFKQMKKVVNNLEGYIHGSKLNCSIFLDNKLHYLTDDLLKTGLALFTSEELRELVDLKGNEDIGLENPNYNEEKYFTVRFWKYIDELDLEDQNYLADIYKFMDTELVDIVFPLLSALKEQRGILNE